MNQQQDPGAIEVDRREEEVRQTGGTAGTGSLGTGTYNDQGNLTGPDSPAGSDAAPSTTGEAQGDDLANRLGGERPQTGSGAATGDISAGRSEPTTSPNAGVPDPGDPGGLGGVRAQGGTGTGRPPGGVSPAAGRNGESD